MMETGEERQVPNWNDVQKVTIGGNHQGYFYVQIEETIDVDNIMDQVRMKKLSRYLRVAAN
jgi:hypothetical protein